MKNHFLKFALGLLLLGITVFFSGRVVFPYFQQAWDSNDWPSTMGFITQSEVDETAGEYGNKRRLLFTYRYEVNGVLYHNSGRYMNEGETPQRAKGGLYKFAEEHPSGDSITVYYNPYEPGNASTFTGTYWLHWVMLGLCIAFAYLTIKLLFFPDSVKFRRYY